MQPRRLLLAMPLLLLAGCAAQGPQAPVSASALRFATNLGAADQAVEAAVGRMDEFERLATREQAAITYAAGGRDAAGARFSPPGAGVSEAVGHVLNAAFTALGDYGHVLAQIAAGQPAQAKASPSGAELTAEIANWLENLRRLGGGTLAEPVRTAGLAGVSALADLPESWAKRPGEESLATVVQEAQPHIVAVAGMLREMLGATAEQGARSVIRSHRLALDAAQSRFLAAVRADRNAGPAERYALFRAVSELREGDPAPGTMAGIVTALTALEQAHTALATSGEGPDAAAKVAAFEAAVAQLGALSEASRRED